MPPKAFRIFAVVGAVALGIAYVSWSLPVGAFGGSKAGVIRVDPPTQPTPTPVPTRPLMHSSKLGIFFRGSDLPGDPAWQTLNPPAETTIPLAHREEPNPRPLKQMRALMGGSKSGMILPKDFFKGPVKPHLIETTPDGRDMLSDPRFWSSEPSWQINFEEPAYPAPESADPFATPGTR